MLGAIAGDTIGSVHEYLAIKTKDFPLFSAGSEFTDDSVRTIAVADAILNII
jgi:ADP-ribosylglycohydrolase